MTQEEKAKAYDEALERAKKWYNAPNVDKIPTYANRIIEELFPALAESEDEKIRKRIYYYINVTLDDNESAEKENWLAWLEKQGQVKGSLISQHENKTCKENDDSLTSEDERIKKELIKLLRNLFNNYSYFIKDPFYTKCIAWLEKQGQSKKTSIWKHWEDGIAGNGDGIPVFLIKNGSTYSLSSCLGFECDYIELSELDNLMLEQQGKYETIWKPTKEQLNALTHFIRSIGESGYASPYDNNTKLLYSLLHDLEQLEKQGEQKELSQSKVTKISDQEWSEEFDENLMMIEDRFSDYLDYIREDSSLTKHRKNTLKEEIIGYVNWLKTLKERFKQVMEE